AVLVRDRAVAAREPERPHHVLRWRLEVRELVGLAEARSAGGAPRCRPRARPPPAGLGVGWGRGLSPFRRRGPRGARLRPAPAGAWASTGGSSTGSPASLA